MDTPQETAHRGVSDYAVRQEAKRERLEARAAKARREGEAASQRSREMYDAIPFGQPILVGHHSEGRDRRYRDRAWNLMGKGVALQQQAADLAERAATVGTAGISSDDPDAIAQLRAKRAAVEAQRDRTKEVNRLVRAAKLDALVQARDAAGAAEALKALPITDTERGALLDQLRHFGRFKLAPEYATREIARIDERIKALEQQATTAYPTVEGDGWTLEDDPERNRLRLTVSYRLSREAFQWLRGMGWRWARTEGAFLAYRHASIVQLARECFAERLAAQ